MTKITRVVTLFANRDQPGNPELLSLDTALGRIKEGESRALVEKIRFAMEKKDRTALKAQLPCICFSGQFPYRKDEQIQRHSGHIVLDFDDAADPYGLKRELFAYPFMKAVWLSPSGTGVKALVRVPNVSEQHRGHFAALEKKFEGIDPSGKDRSRICYESFDPTIMIRQDAELEIFEEYLVPNETPPRAAMPTGLTSTDYSKLNVAAAMIRNAPDGAKHDVLLKAAKLVGGYIATGIVDEQAAVRILEAEISGKANVDDFKSATLTIRDGIEYGKRQPLYDQVPEEQPLPKTQSTHSVVFLSAKWETMKHQHTNGKVRGTTTYIPGMDGHFSWKKKEVTLGSGYPNTGKSEWWYGIALLKAVNDGTKFAVFGPEAGDPEEFYDGLIHTLVGKSVDPAYNNQMSAREYAIAGKFVGDHFFFIDPDTEHTIADVEANFEYCIRELGCEGVILDPYNALSDVSSERDDKHLQQFLNKRIRFARTHDIYYIIIAHPKSDRKLNKEGEYDVPGFFDMAGGAMWANKVHNFIVVHRPFQNTEPSNTIVDIHIKKIKKQRLVGIPGIVRYSFDRAKNRYTKHDHSQDRGVSPFERSDANPTWVNGELL